MIAVEGLSVPEGPVLLDDGSWLVVEMGPDRGCVTQLRVGAERRVVARTGRPNGLAVDSAGTIWAAESMPPALLRMELDGRYDVVADAVGGRPMLFPNDLCFGPDGMLYLTDSGIRFEDFAPGGVVREDYLTVPIDGSVLRVDPTTGAVTELDRGIAFTNGLAFGPGDTHLYVAETITGDILRYPWSPEGLGPREVFGNVLTADWPGGIRGPDGIAFGADGDLYVAVFGQGDVTVLAPDGSVRRRIAASGAAPTNVAFGPPGGHEIFVTEDAEGRLERFAVPTDGLPLHRGAVVRTS